MRPLIRTAFSITILSTLMALIPGTCAIAGDLAMPGLTPQQRTLSDQNEEGLEVQVLTIPSVDVWERIRRGFSIPDLENPLVATQTTWYATRPDYIQRTTLRASRYLYHVVEELEKRNMPTELALLPFIESAFNPQAFSSAKAVGMWQFMPATGLDFNLRQSSFKDDRRDVLASTEAALTYLQRLYGMFGDWQLALAAYNWGEGSVQKAINRNRAAGLPTDFNGLSPLMPIETRNYYPKLQAVKNIIGSPEQYSISLPKVENEPYFVSVGKTRDIDIKVAAQLAELSIDEFKALNPQFSKPVITGSNANTQILLPQLNAVKFKTNLAKWGNTLSSWTSHTVTVARERIDTIAAKFGTTSQVIREVNNIPPNMRLRVGSTILVPKPEFAIEKDIASDLVERSSMMIEPDVADTRRVYIKVGKTDTLEAIAARNRVTVLQIKTWNKLRQDKVATGQSLVIYSPVQFAAKKKTGKNVARKSTQPRGKVASGKAKPQSKPVASAKKSGSNS